jgi:hypothetical protein
MHRATPFILLFSIAACSDGSREATAPVFSSDVEISANRSDGPNGRNRFGTRLTGAEEVPPRVTEASGRAVFKLSRDGQTLEWSLTVRELSNVVQAHIHLGARGANGPVVLFLLGAANPPANGNPPTTALAAPGIVARGSLTVEDWATAANLRGPLAGQPLSALIEEIRAGNAYVNVHTNDGLPPNDTGPGDHPGGEVRGQLPAKRHGGHDDDDD